MTLKRKQMLEGYRRALEESTVHRRALSRREDFQKPRKVQELEGGTAQQQ